MTEKQTNPVQILVDAVLLATRRGAFELMEAAQIAEAVKELTKPAPVNGVLKGEVESV